jgi:hypothetical protein
MANCARCGRKAGGFTFRTLNTAGRCDECEKDIRDSLERLRSHFQALTAKGNLTKEEWVAFERRASEAGIDLTDALTYIRKDVRVVIETLIDHLRKESESSLTEDSDFKYIAQRLSIPDSYIEEIRSLLFEIHAAEKTAAALGKGNAAILCIRCGAGVVGSATACDFACSACGFRAIIRRCPFCSIPVHIHQDLWGRRVKCLKCGQENSWAKWNSRAVMLGELAKSYTADQEIIADPSRRIASGTVIGGSGYPIPARVGCKLDFRSDKIVIAALVQGGQYQGVALAEYVDVTSLQVGGRGAITTGGGFVGGGFGLKGIVTGVLLAGALNRATTRTTIETVIHFRTREGELILLNTQYTPEQLSVMLSPVVNRIEVAHQQTTQQTQASPLDQLRDLGELRASGTISEEEFQSLKATIIGHIK